MNLLGYLLLTGAWPLALAVLATAFLVVRAREGAIVDLASGATAYTSIVLATVAVVAATGIAGLLTGALGAIDADYTYGPGGVSGLIDGYTQYSDFNGSPIDLDRNNRDFAEGLALLLTAVVFGWLHLGIRMQLDIRGLLDRTVEHAVEAFVAVVAGILTVVLAGVAFAQVLQRAMADSSRSAPGETIAVACAAAAVLLVYGARVGQGLGIGPAWLLRTKEREEVADEEPDA